METKKDIVFTKDEVFNIVDIILSEYKNSLKNNIDFYPTLILNELIQKISNNE